MAKTTAVKTPAKKRAAKEIGAGSSGGAKEVIVGRLTDWPLGARLAALLGLPKSVTGVGCFQVLGEHGAAVSKKVFAVEEKIPPSLTPFEHCVHAALAVGVTRAGGPTNTGFHANLSPEELAAHLRDEYVVRSPAEALEARRLTPEQSLRKIEEALPKAIINCPRKYLLEYLEGGKLRDSLLGAKAYGLSHLLVASPEAFNEVDARLFHLWARRAHDGDGPPMPQPDTPELGFDCFGTHLQQLVAAGLHEDAAIGYFLRKSPMEHARWWPSTGVWVWEQLVADPRKLLQHTLVEAHVEPFDGEIEDAIVELLTSVLWLPKAALDAGALGAALKVCASPALVPERSLEKLRKDAQLHPLLASLTRSDEPPAPARPTVSTRDGRPLIAG